MYEKFGLEGIIDETAQDEFKEMFYETNIYLAGITVLVSILHTIFSGLAIKTDIMYWKNLQN